jgi:O-antigen/teichoic acid export membrane protein
MLSLQDLARYTVAGLLAQAPSIITLPIVLSLLPRLTRWVNDCQHERLIETYHRFSFVIASIAATTGFIVAFNSLQIITWWTGSEEISIGLGWTVQILTAGHVMLALQYMPYNLALAHGHVKTNIIIGTAFLTITPFLLVVLIDEVGIEGAAIPWLIMNICGALLLAIIITSRFLERQTVRWFTKGFSIPLLITSFCAGFIQWAWSVLGLNPENWMWNIVAFIVTSGLTCLLAYVLMFSRLRISE